MSALIRLVKISLVLVVMLLMISCGGKKVERSTSADQDIKPLECVVVLPTQLHNRDQAEFDGTMKTLQTGATFLDDTIEKNLKGSAVKKIIDDF